MQIHANSFFVISPVILTDHERLQARWRGKMTRRRYIAEQELLGNEVSLNGVVRAFRHGHGNIVDCCLGSKQVHQIFAPKISHNFAIHHIIIIQPYTVCRNLYVVKRFALKLSQHPPKASSIKHYSLLTKITHASLRKPAGRLGVVSPCERSEN